MLASEERRAELACGKKGELEMEKLRLEIEAKKLGQSQSCEQLNEGFVKMIVKNTTVTFFVDGKDNLGKYRLQFKRSTDVAK